MTNLLSSCQITLQSHTDVTAEGIKKLIEAFEPMGVTKTQIEKFCQCRAEAIKPAQIVRLRSIYTSLRDGMSSPSDWFEPDETQAPAAIEAKAEPSLKDKIKARKAKSVAETVEAKPAEEAQEEIRSEELPL